MSEEKAKRIRRSSDAVRKEKISILEEKIRDKENQILALKAKVEALRKPPVFSKKEREQFFKQKIDDGTFTVEEAYQLGYKA